MKYCITLACCFIALAMYALDADEILLRADNRRAVASSFRFTISITDYKDGMECDRAKMSGNAKGVDKTMVQYEEPVNMRGKKLLMINDEMYVFVPKTRRPVRLTASQRLMGQASNGDVMNVRYSADYIPRLTGEETIQIENESVHCLVLELNAKRKGCAYNRMVLWVDKNGCFPVKADCYALSGKLVKTVFYSGRMHMGGHHIVTKASLYDRVQENSHTVIEFLEMVEEDISENLFNKEFLLRM